MEGERIALYYSNRLMFAVFAFCIVIFARIQNANVIKMKSIALKFNLLMSFFLLVACANETPNTEIVDQETPVEAAPELMINLEAEKAAIEQVVRNFYQWHESNATSDFDVVEKGGKYIAVDRQQVIERMDALRGSGFIAKDFVTNYKKIALEINEKLRDGAIIYKVGDVAPYGGNTDPWCNCQCEDLPENYWKSIVIENIDIKENQATLNWKGAADATENYQVQLINEEGAWKISYLQGFDMNQFFAAI